MQGEDRATATFRSMGGRKGPDRAHLWGMGRTITLLGATLSKVSMYTTSFHPGAAWKGRCNYPHFTERELRLKVAEEGLGNRCVVHRYPDCFHLPVLKMRWGVEF